MVLSVHMAKRKLIGSRSRNFRLTKNMERPEYYAVRAKVTAGGKPTLMDYNLSKSRADMTAKRFREMGFGQTTVVKQFSRVKK